MSLDEVADGVLVRTSRRAGTTTTLVLGARGPAGDRSGLLVDPAWEADELAVLADELDARRVRLVAGLATHAHHDHLLWHPRYGDVPRWASAGTVAEVGRRRRNLLRAVQDDGGPYPADVAATFARLRRLPGDRVPLPESLGAVRAITHDAHAVGHTAVWLPGPRVLVAGDMLSDVEIPLVLDDHDGGRPARQAMTDYVVGLERLAPYVQRAAVVVPGHGTLSYRPGARLDRDRRYLEAVGSGRDPDDPRLDDPAMAAEHGRLTAALRA